MRRRYSPCKMAATRSYFAFARSVQILAFRHYATLSEWAAGNALRVGESTCVRERIFAAMGATDFSSRLEGVIAALNAYKYQISSGI